MNRTDFLNGIFSGYENAKNNDTFLSVNSYDELKAITEQQASEKAFASFTLCGGEYVAYMAISRPYYEVILFVYSPNIDGNGQLVYLDELIHYYGEVNKRLEKMIIKSEANIFSEGQISAEPLKDYEEYRRKWHFLLNVYPKKFGCVYAGYIGKPTPEQERMAKIGYYCLINMSYFEAQWQVKHYTKLWEELEQKHDKKLAEDMDYFKQAAKYEMYNYECCYGERYEEALEAIGVSRDNLTDKQKEVYRTAYNEYRYETRYL